MSDLYTLHLGDCLQVMRGMADDSVDLVMGSPPYENLRSYGGLPVLSGQAWVDWMVEVYRESLRICTGLVAFVVEGKTRNYRYSATPALLMADLHRAGIALRNPLIYHRKGIPGSGGPDWMRNDKEWIICATRGGRLPWSDNKALGKPPKYGPGGEMSHRMRNGERVNGKVYYKQHVTPGYKEGKLHHDKTYSPPDIANPGSVVSLSVGGGKMGGDRWAKLNEAPYSEHLCTFMIKSFCRPGGVVLDPYMGSGTTGAVALRHGRKFVGIELRQSQVDISRERLENEVALLSSRS